ncbi:NUDIX hydrolase domain-like protein [Nemania sp. FL0031]|nr:NUDIX hydrolase domain-like protein [Nemania sp. FL0031]
MDKVSTHFDFDLSVASFGVPLDTYLKTIPMLQGVCVGAFVFDDQGRLLLLQRSKTDSYPRLWEVPGGTIDDEDVSLLHGLVRELEEETGLRARRVTGVVGKGVTFLTREPACVCKYSFIVDIEAGDVKIDPKEHEAFVWVTEDEAKAKNCGEIRLSYTSVGQEKAILESFRSRREQIMHGFPNSTGDLPGKQSLDSSTTAF